MTFAPTPRTICQCVPCSECGGSGTIWFSFGHKHYLGQHRCDDLDEMEGCDECTGSGIVEVCDSCQMAYDLEMDNDY